MSGLYQDLLEVLAASKDVAVSKEAKWLRSFIASDKVQQWIREGRGLDGEDKK